ncbi:MAG TPA: hypothetical protein VKP30_33120 [Polyangiaceae bacterium]|nr:hypothetical protein [Polyangiaceae bacterium]
MRRAILVLGFLGWVLAGASGCGDHEPGMPGVARRKPVSTNPDGLGGAGTTEPPLADAGLVPSYAGSDAGSTEPEPPDAQVVVPPVIPQVRFVAADTLASALVRAGEPIVVTCLLVDDAQRTQVPGLDVKFLAKVLDAGAAEARPDGTFTAVRAGEIRISCEFPALGFADPTPAVVKVIPGSPARAEVSLDRAALSAGESVAATCSVLDAWNNAIANAQPSLRSIPEDARNTIAGLQGTYTRAGSYDVHCVADGTASPAAKLEVRAALPANLTIARVPEQLTYSVRQKIGLSSQVNDRFGNAITNASVSVTSDPAGSFDSAGSVSYSKAGTYRLTATVAPPTEGSVELTKTAEVLVDSSGPKVNCDAPLDGELLTRSPGDSLTLQGTVTDPSGVQELRVNGVPVDVDAANHFSAKLTSEFGVNFVSLVATDAGGRKTTRNCAYLVANDWAADDTSVGDNLSYRLRQDAVDDGSRQDFDSLADVLHAGLASPGLRDAVHAAMLERANLKSGCDQLLGDVCLLRSKVTYLDTQLDGPNSVSLKLVDGGIASSTRIENLRLKIGVEVEVPGLGYQRVGWFIFQSIDVATVFEIGVEAGRPRVRVRPGSTTSAIGRIDTDFPGVEGQVLDTVVELLGGIVRDYVALRVQAYVADSLGAGLDSVVSGINISNLGTQFEVAPLDSGAPIPLRFAAEFSSVSTSPERILFGFGTRFGGPTTNTRPALGVPLETRQRLFDVSGAEAVGVAIDENVLAQGVYALWRAEYFDASITPNASDLALPEGVRVGMSVALPPVVQVVGTRIRVSLGKVNALLDYAGRTGAPIPINLGARASMAVSLDSGAFKFDDFVLDELHVSIDAPELDDGIRIVFEAMLPKLVEYVVGNTLAKALPGFPMPTLPLGSVASSFGFPTGAALGIATPSFSAEPPRLVLRGNSALVSPE